MPRSIVVNSQHTLAPQSPCPHSVNKGTCLSACYCLVDITVVPYCLQTDQSRVAGCSQPKIYRVCNYYTARGSCSGYPLTKFCTVRGICHRLEEEGTPWNRNLPVHWLPCVPLQLPHPSQHHTGLQLGGVLDIGGRVPPLPDPRLPQARECTHCNQHALLDHQSLGQ